MFGLIILLKSYVEVDRDNSKMQYSFRLTFEQDTTTIYYLAAENPQDMVEWILALRSVGCVCGGVVGVYLWGVSVGGVVGCVCGGVVGCVCGVSGGGVSVG